MANDKAQSFRAVRGVGLGCAAAVGVLLIVRGLALGIP
jgi:hypothetical protein